MRVDTQYSASSSPYTGQIQFSDDLLNWDVPPYLGRRRVNCILVKLTRQPFLRDYPPPFVETPRPVSHPQLPEVTDAENDLEPLILPSNDEYLKYFADLTNKNKVLAGLYEVLKQGRLFVEIKSPNSLYYRQYIDLLQSIVFANKEYFSSLTLQLSKKASTNFKDEFIKLRNHIHLSELQKAFLLTEVIFLALNNINPVDPMVRIEQSKIEKLNQGNGKKEIIDHTIGGRNELRALTLLLLFNEEIKKQKDLRMSTCLSTYKRRIAPDFSKIFIIRPVSRFDSEVDFQSEEVIGSVKSKFKRLEVPLIKLFFRIIDDERLGLKYSLSKLVLVKTSDDRAELDAELDIDYMDSDDYKNFKDTVIAKAREMIKKTEVPPKVTPEQYESCLNRLISHDCIDIFFIPAVDNYKSLETYMKKRFELALVA